MIIKFKIFNRNFSISIGYNTPWFQQLHFITAVEEFYTVDSRGFVIDTYFANSIFTFWSKKDD